MRIFLRINETDRLLLQMLNLPATLGEGCRNKIGWVEMEKTYYEMYYET